MLSSYRLHHTQVHIPKKRTLIQVLPPAKAYTKLFANCSYIFSYPFVSHSCIYAIRPVCLHHSVRFGCLIAILGQNAYMHEQKTKEFEGRKYLYECTPFGDVSLCIDEKQYITIVKKSLRVLAIKIIEKKQTFPSIILLLM